MACFIFIRLTDINQLRFTVAGAEFFFCKRLNQLALIEVHCHRIGDERNKDDKEDDKIHHGEIDPFFHIYLTYYNGVDKQCNKDGRIFVSFHKQQ